MEDITFMYGSVHVCFIPPAQGSPFIWWDTPFPCSTLCRLFFLCMLHTCRVNFNSRLESTKMPKSGSKKVLARIWPQRAVSQGFQKQMSRARWQAPKCPSLAPKGSWPGFGPKGPSPKVSRSKFQYPAGKPQIAEIRQVWCKCWTRKPKMLTRNPWKR